jgi:RNA methyltransferase, TrmH family
MHVASREGIRQVAKPDPRPTIDGHLRRIEGRHHPLVKDLRQAFARDDVSSEGCFAIEGFRLVEEAIRSGLKLRTVFLSASARAKAERLLPQIGPHTETVLLGDRLFSSAVRTETPQGVAALVCARAFKLEDVLKRSQFGPIVVLAGLQDPGNLGTIIRSAEAFEAAGVLLGENTVSPLNGKAVRASAGSLFRLPVVRVQLAEVVARLREHGIRRFATRAHKGTPLPAAALTDPFAVFLGGEGGGLGPHLMRDLGEVLAIPHAGMVESLNAGVACSILLYEAWRQRKSA